MCLTTKNTNIPEMPRVKLQNAGHFSFALMQSIGNRKFKNENHLYSTNTNFSPKDEGLMTKMRV